MSTAARAQRGASDLGVRVLVAIPADRLRVFIIAMGGWVFAIGILVLGFVCMHELFRMYESVRPVRLAAFLALAGFAVAAKDGRRAAGAARARRVRSR